MDICYVQICIQSTRYICRKLFQRQNHFVRQIMLLKVLHAYFLMLGFIMLLFSWKQLAACSIDHFCKKKFRQSFPCLKCVSSKHGVHERNKDILILIPNILTALFLITCYYNYLTFPL